jgi:hypothetical protein
VDASGGNGAARSIASASGLDDVVVAAGASADAASGAAAMIAAVTSTAAKLCPLNCIKRL